MTRNDLVVLAKEKLGPLFKASDEQVISHIGDTVIDEALITANASENETELTNLKAVIVESIVIAYENRGAEGTKSQGDLGQSNSFIDWMEYLHTHIIEGGKRYFI